MLPDRFRRSIAIAIPVFTAVTLFGLTESIFKVGITENLMQTGVTLATVLGVLNAVMVWLVVKKRVP